MPASHIERVQDAVHGLMEFRGMETLVIDVLRTPEMQRLRRVRQLGLVHLVFPGAEHSRLVHSLGTAYLAVLFGRRLADAAHGYLSRFLVPDEVAIRDFALAALFHDLGHGPLSHAWEREIIGEKYAVAAWRRALQIPDSDTFSPSVKWHVLVGQGLLAWPDGELHRLLEQHEEGSSDRLRAFLRGHFHIPYLPRLLDSDIDVDRADFIRRDTHQSGVMYGGYDLNWLISTCTVGETDGVGLVAGFDRRKAVRVVEQFLIARRALYETVYHHKTVRAAEGMVARFLRRLRTTIRDLDLAQDRVTAPLIRMAEGETVGPADLLSADDFALHVLIDAVARLEKGDEVVRDLARRIVARDLFKVVPCPSARLADFLMKPTAYELLNDLVGKHHPHDPESYYIVDRSHFRMLAERPSEWGYFVDSDRHAEPIRDHDSIRPLWQESHEVVRLFVPRELVEDVAHLIR